MFDRAEAQVCHIGGQVERLHRVGRYAAFLRVKILHELAQAVAVRSDCAPAVVGDLKFFGEPVQLDYFH
ncbi:MAG: hypothetical protein PHW12_00715 [Smithella sp.]|nr:hypothetical protein [Smithella sp.]